MDVVLVLLLLILFVVVLALLYKFKFGRYRRTINDAFNDYIEFIQNADYVKAADVRRNALKSRLPYAKLDATSLNTLSLDKLRMIKKFANELTHREIVGGNRAELKGVKEILNYFDSLGLLYEFDVDVLMTELANVGININITTGTNEDIIKQIVNAIDTNYLPEKIIPKYILLKTYIPLARSITLTKEYAAKILEEYASVKLGEVKTSLLSKTTFNKYIDSGFTSDEIRRAIGDELLNKINGNPFGNFDYLDTIADRNPSVNIDVGKAIADREYKLVEGPVLEKVDSLNLLLGDWITIAVDYPSDLIPGDKYIINGSEIKWNDKLIIKNPAAYKSILRNAGVPEDLLTNTIFNAYINFNNIRFDGEGFTINKNSSPRRVLRYSPAESVLKLHADNVIEDDTSYIEIIKDAMQKLPSIASKRFHDLTDDAKLTAFVDRIISETNANANFIQLRGRITSKDEQDKSTVLEKLKEIVSSNVEQVNNYYKNNYNIDDSILNKVKEMIHNGDFTIGNQDTKNVLMYYMDNPALLEMSNDIKYKDLESKCDPCVTLRKYAREVKAGNDADNKYKTAIFDMIKILKE
jgi:hypothetical protein